MIEVSGQIAPTPKDKIFVGGETHSIKSVTLRDTEDGGGEHGQWVVVTKDGRVLVMDRHLEWTKA